MLEDSIRRGIATALTGALIALLRWLAPARFRAIERRYDETQKSEPLPAGVAGAAMWGVAILLALTYFALIEANRLWAAMEGPSDLLQLAPKAIWCFFPGVAALSIPWPLVVWYLRKRGRWEDADTIEDDADHKGGGNQYAILKWMAIGLALPIGLFTLLAIPIHLSVSGFEVRVGHYASLRTERFDLRDASRATLVDGYRLRDGTFQPAKDLIIDFKDGRQLHGNQVGDGGTNIRGDLLQLMLAKLPVAPGHFVTEADIPPAEQCR